MLYFCVWYIFLFVLGLYLALLHIIIFTDNQIVRGCSDNKPNACDETTNCKTCSTINCNDEKVVLSSPELKCIQCNSKVNEACLWAFLEETATPCRSSVPFLTKESCYATRDVDGGVYRGCTVDDSVDCELDSCIKVCSEDGCNFDSYKTQSCVQCTTANNKCLNSAGSISPTTCLTFTPYERRGCYYIKDEQSSIFGI